MSTTPLGDPQTMPIDDLRQQAFPASDPAPVAPVAEPVVTAPTPAPTPAPAPEQFSVQQDDSGVTVQMAPEFGGEVFKGKDWAEVGPKIAKAKADANAYARTLKSQIPAAPQSAQPTTPALTPEQEQATSVRRWMVDLFKEDPNAAKEFVSTALGIPIDNLIQASQQMSLNATIADFHASCPDYVDTPENTAAITSCLPSDMDHFPTPQELKQAYAMALYEGKIQRQAPGQTASGRPTPPPMPGGSAPSGGGENPWTMDREALKRQVFGQ